MVAQKAMRQASAVAMKVAMKAAGKAVTKASTKAAAQAAAKAVTQPKRYADKRDFSATPEPPAEAASVYRQGIVHCPAEALLHFNLGVALEHHNRDTEAMAAYEAALALDPMLANARFNLARLHGQRGHERQAIGHFSACRQLERPRRTPGPPKTPGPRGRP